MIESMLGPACVQRLPSVVLLMLLAARTEAVPIAVDWSNTFMFSAPGVQNPLLQVGFNPQPEPPEGGVLSFGAPPNPAYPPDPIITHAGATSGTPFRLLLGVGADTPLYVDTAGFVGPGVYALTIGDLASPTGSILFEVRLALGTSGGGLPIDWVAFNPQPEPPALGAGAVSFAADFTFDAFSDATLAIRLMDVAGMPLALTPVTEPTTLALCAASVLVIAPRITRRRRRARPGARQPDGISGP